MAIVTIPAFEPQVESLYNLANTSFEPEEFKRCCQSFAPINPSSLIEDDLWEFQAHIDAPLTVAIYTEATGEKKATGYPVFRQLGVSCAILPFCWWETWMESDHPSKEQYREEREQFDKKFDEELERAVRLIGDPLKHGQDGEPRAHKFAYWRGTTGLLILQQSAHDPQFGEDINYWVQPWSGADPQPDSPMIEWLHKLSRLPPGVVLPDSWELSGAGLDEEFARELSFNILHPLRKVKSHAVARKKSSDDVLMQLYQHSHALAQVHLTWSIELLPGAPEFQLFKTWSDWLQDQALSSEG
ncbi:MAG: hypothetical protein K2X93_25785 [Candidatus Obscuribacterales bacterium]|nr:hypothetical protein [Candidatus Obscuribacterales bacterium]